MCVVGGREKDIYISTRKVYWSVLLKFIIEFNYIHKNDNFLNREIAIRIGYNSVKH